MMYEMKRVINLVKMLKNLILKGTASLSIDNLIDSQPRSKYRGDHTRAMGML
jgi:hypothetical protein